MALRGSTTSLLTFIPKRYASSAAAAQSKTEAKRALPKEPVRVTKLENGIVVASLENYSPVTRIAAVVNVGSRDEAHLQQGAAHGLRVFSSLATRNYSLFGLSRHLNQIGSELSVTSTREQTTYLLEGARDKVERGADILSEIISRPEFRDWEVEDAKERLKFDLDVYDESPELRIVDLIHRAAFRNALSRSLYAPRFNLDNIDAETIREFRQKNFTANRLTLVGVGIKHEDLLQVSDSFKLPSAGNFAREQSKYFGSELREENLSQLVHVALASEGASYASKDLFTSAVASHVFGVGAPKIKYSSGASKIQKAVLPLANGAASVSAFNANYSDNGLFGFHVIANKSDVGKVVKGIFKEVQKASKDGVSNDELTRAKNSAKISLAYALENTQNLIDGIAKHPDAKLDEIFKKVDAVSANDVNAFFKRIATSKPSLAAIGDLSELPRIDELSA